MTPEEAFEITQPQQEQEKDFLRAEYDIDNFLNKVKRGQATYNDILDVIPALELFGIRIRSDYENR